MSNDDRAALVPPSARRMIWVALACWLVTWRGPVLLGSLLNPTANNARFSVPDFFQDYASARSLSEGGTAYIDHSGVVGAYLRPGVGEVPTFVVNAHPPPSITIFLPFGFLDFPSAFRLWDALSVVALLYALAIVSQRLNPRGSWWDWFPIGSYLLVSYPVQDQIRMGQTSAVLLLLLAGAWAALRAERAVTAGILLGAATCLKLMPGLFLVYLAATRRWKALAASFLTIAALVAVSLPVAGVEAYRDYVLRVLPSIQRFRVYWPNVSLVGFWTKLFDPVVDFHRTYSLVEPLSQSPWLASSASVLSAVLVVTVAAWASWRCRDSQTGRDLGFALTIVASLLIGPLTWPHSLLPLLIAFPILWGAADSKTTRVALITVAAMLSVQPQYYWALVLPSADVVTAKPWQVLSALSLQFYALALLFVIGSIFTSRHRDSGIA